MKKTLIGLLLLLYGQRAHSIVQDSVYRFSAKQAVEYALQNQMDVQNARLDAGISKAQVREIVGIGLPQVNSSFDVQHFVELPTSLLPAEFFEGEAGEFIPIQFGTKWNATGNLSASQLLFDPTYLLGVKATRTFHELATRNLSRTETETALNVYKAYYNNLLLIERRKVLDANVQRITKLHDDTKALYENGFVEKLDYDRVKLELNNIRSEQDKFGRLILLSDQILKFQIGMNAQMKLILTDSLSSSDIKNISVPLEKADVTKRIEYSILQTQSQLQEYNIRRYRAGYYPTLHAYGSLSANAQRTEMNFFDSDRRWFSTAVVGATVRFPIFDGLQKNSKIRQEKLSLQKIRNEIKSFEQGALIEISAKRNSLVDALNSLEVQEQNLQLATDIYNISKIKYDQGVGSSLEIMDAETSLKDAQTNYFSAMYEAVISKIELDKSMGNSIY